MHFLKLELLHTYSSSFEFHATLSQLIEPDNQWNDQYPNQPTTPIHQYTTPIHQSTNYLIHQSTNPLELFWKEILCELAIDLVIKSSNQILLTEYVVLNVVVQHPTIIFLLLLFSWVLRIEYYVEENFPVNILLLLSLGWGVRKTYIEFCQHGQPPCINALMTKE